MSGNINNSEIESTEGAIGTIHPNMYLNMDEINAIKVMVHENKEPWKEAYDKFMGSDESYGGVEWAMGLPKQSVTYKNSANCGDHHTYCTVSNPWKGTGREDYEAALKVGKAVRSLGLAYALTGKNKFADKAIQLINTWCLDSGTYMRPKAGNFQSRIELSVTMPGIFYGADLIWDYSGWNKDKRGMFKNWVKDLADNAKGWIASGCYPCKTGSWCQNQETWRLAFMASASVIIEDSNIRNDTVDKWKKLIHCQIGTDGRMIRENREEKTLFYATYAINAFVQTAEIARHYGIDLYSYKTDDGRCLEKALDYYAPRIINPPADQTYRPRANAAIYELAYSRVEKKSIYKDVVNKIGRPMYEERVIGPITLTHGSSFSTAVLTSIIISPVLVSTSIGTTKQLDVACKDQDNNVVICPDLTWSSSNTSIATVNDSGLVTGVSEGTTNIETRSGSVISNVATIVVSYIPAGYKLVWEENFGGTSLDTTKWYIRGTPGEVIVSNSVVKIGPGSGGIETGKSSQPSKFSFKYGYVEIKAKLASTGNENSYSSQLWLYEEGTANKDEIDITETSSGPIGLTGNKGRDKMNTTIHCPDQPHSNGRTRDTNVDLSSGYHIYAVEWTPDHVKCLFDGTEWAKITPTSAVCIPSNLMYIVLTLCKKWDPNNSGQCWPSTDKATINAYMYIDYVKMYQKK